MKRGLLIKRLALIILLLVGGSLEHLHCENDNVYVIFYMLCILLQLLKSGKYIVV